MSVDPARLTAVPLFAALTDDERAGVAAKLEERTADVGDHLSTEGGAGYFFFVIESGGATVTRDGQTLGRVRSRRLLRRGRHLQDSAADGDRDRDGTDEAVRDVRSRLRQAGGRHPRAAHGDRRGTGGTSSRVTRRRPGTSLGRTYGGGSPTSTFRCHRAPTTRRLRRAAPARSATTPSVRASRPGSARRRPAPSCGARSSAATCPAAPAGCTSRPRRHPPPG